MKTLVLKLAATGTLALAALTISQPANACRPHHCTPSSSGSSSTSTSTGSTGGTEVPAPAGFALFGLAALGLVARNRAARRAR